MNLDDLPADAKAFLDAIGKAESKVGHVPATKRNPFNSEDPVLRDSVRQQLQHFGMDSSDEGIDKMIAGMNEEELKFQRIKAGLEPMPSPTFVLNYPDKRTNEQRLLDGIPRVHNMGERGGRPANRNKRKAQKKARKANRK